MISTGSGRVMVSTGSALEAVTIGFSPGGTGASGAGALVFKDLASSAAWADFAARDMLTESPSASGVLVSDEPALEICGRTRGAAGRMAGEVPVELTEDGKEMLTDIVWYR